MSIKPHPSLAVHPGDWLRTEIMEPHGLSVRDVAAKLRVARYIVSDLLNGRTGLSAEMVIRFEKMFRLRADTLMRIQAAYDLAEVTGKIAVKRVAA